MSYPLVCLGNPLLDLQVDVESDFLRKYDLKDNDAILAEEKHLPIYGEVLQNKSLQLLAGGAAQNTARGAQYILPENSVVYFGAVGKDVYAEKLTEANTKYGLKTQYQVLEEQSTGKCAALIYNHHRSLVTDLGAANHFKASHLQKPENWEFVSNAKYFYIGGFHFTVSPEAIQLLGKHAAETNKVFAINFSAPFIPQFFKDPLDAAIPYTDFVIANESEAAAYAESHSLDLAPTDVVGIAKHIAQLPKVNSARSRTVVFTQGTEPTVVVTTVDGELVVKEYAIRELSADQVVDTNGAGDAFASGFMASLVLGEDVSKAVSRGQWAASVSIQCVGPAFPFPKVEYSA
ncbi:uncharacterized protein KQ657_002188 [Scheffersomyces spartinae]|uniref:Adenosine kinase n=1 Tax=Scheffersomyces spartinae TaxID=45513 RepID=A0A9P7VE53_9ASCO|nr:uncharacterized protein KQ657_002188 [Scheffersomyces spartinae]KAG7195803.1 hypothetical protein KQ657_002188 [Scheffersomyces spartinae]